MVQFLIVFVGVYLTFFLCTLFIKISLIQSLAKFYIEHSFALSIQTLQQLFSLAHSKPACQPATRCRRRLQRFYAQEFVRSQGRGNLIHISQLRQRT